MVKKLPNELINNDEETIRIKLSDSVNGILADLSEFITDDWSSDEENEIEE